MKLGVALIALLLAGCPKPGLTAAESKTVDDYTAEQLLCVEKAKTLAESRACRCEVKAKYGRPCQEGGR